MSTQNTNKLNWLMEHLPEGVPVDAAWLRMQGYTANLLRKYEASGWLSQPAHRVYVRPRGELAWQQIVISLQTLLSRELVVGGRAALELQGHVHYLKHSKSNIFLYGPEKPPTWLKDLATDARFIYRNDAKLFRKERARFSVNLTSVEHQAKKISESLTITSWGQWKWPLVISTPERALLELLDELPDHESFHQVDVLVEGLSTLSPTRMQRLLLDCQSVKVKRLFFFFADRHQHAWLRRLDRKAVDLGSGRRMIAKGGIFDAKHLITVPKEFDGVQ